MKKRIVFGLVVAAMLATLAVIWIPGCGYVDTWLFWTWSCDSAGGGGSGAS